MAKVDIIINNIKYSIVCSEGHESYVESLAHVFSERVEEINKDLKSSDNARLFLIVALLFVDEVQALQKEKESRSHSQVSESKGEGAAITSQDETYYQERLEGILERVKKIAQMSKTL